ncbi:MAG TPA: toxin-antitoxin system HicB family antitoxin [Ktedonobacteraceae bacterium]|jgi:predicted DNA-binding protein|nr:toxin-antitoxin system HicB family antitoxin [Ktedonobacteraceae bacterium]
MALRKEALNGDYPERKHAMKRSRITIDVSPELRQRIKMAAAQSGTSINDYVGKILEEHVPQVETAFQSPGHPVTYEAVARLRQLREKILEEHGGKPFDDINETIWQMREERLRELEER